MWRFAEDTTMGLGAGGDENVWSDSSMRMALIDSASQSVAESQETMTSSPPPSPPRMTASAPKTNAPSLKKDPSAFELATSSPEETAPLSPEVPHGPERFTQNLSSFQPKDTRLNKDDRLVEVYYGTNRQTRTLPSLGNSIRWVAFGVALVCFLVCVVAFATQRSMRYAFVALLGLLGLTALARDSLDMAYWFPERAGLYSGDYSKEIKYGVCEVSIPPKHTPGEMESPSLLLQWEVRPDPEKHIVLKKTLPLEKDQFLSQLKQCMNQRGKNLLVFVHGYNVSFDDAARRTAQMWFDLKFEGAPVFYSWPSYSNWYRYPDDATNIELSVTQIQTFLQQLARDSGAESINLIAHSMGNVGLTRALASMQTSQPIFNQIVLAAPDIDADVFRGEIAPNIMNKAKRITIYTSKTDLALVASRYFNSRKPLGDSNFGSLSLAGIDTIDATSVDSSLLGHSYYGSNVSVLDDIASLLSGKALNDRPHLKLQAESNPPYWEFSSQTRTATSTSPQRQ
jgi:esterase/lipase superfamily enzyme